MTDQAMRPSFNVPKQVKVKTPDDIMKEKGITDDERFLYGLSQTAGWKVLKERIQELKDGLNHTNKEAISSGASFEEIGRNTIVISLTQDILSKIVNIVEDAKDTCTTDEQ
jgi:hypothetical protein